MTLADPPPAAIFLSFPFVFVGMWLAIGLLLSRISGWSMLAGLFRTDKPAPPDLARFASGTMGHRQFPVRFGSCLWIGTTPQGMYLAIMPVFRFAMPALFIPWSRVESVQTRKYFLASAAEVRLRGLWPVLSVLGRPGEALLQAHARATEQRSA